MDQIIIGWIVAFFITFYSMPVIIQIAEDKKLYDIPDERKIHKNPISSLGGIGIFAGLIVSCLLTISFSINSEFQYYLLSFLIMFFLGVKDDILVISAHKKFIGQLFAAVILVFKGNLVITSMHGFMGVTQIDQSVAILLSIFTILVIINAFNLIDGVDGLAGTVASVTAIVVGVIFAINKDWPYATMAFCLAGALASFLIYNYQPARIFMGDTGSMLLGTACAILVIRLIELGPTYTTLPISASPAMGFGIVLIPLLDTLRVFALRILKRRSPFSPDRNHLHHFLLDRGLNHRTVAILIGAGSLFFALLALILQPLGSTISIGIQVVIFFATIYTLYITKTRIVMRVVKRNGITETKIITERKTVKLVSLFSKEKGRVVEEN